MSATAHPTHPPLKPRELHPLHAVLLIGMLPLFLGAALSDYAYSVSFHIQWSTFASWLIAGALVFNGFAIIAALVGLFRASTRGALAFAYVALLIATWVLGFINALVHARDAWAMMPTGLVLSCAVTLMSLIALFLGFNRSRATGVSV
ncbi:DUF2231 domain-containing protein [Halomonas sp. HNIBRBA4712]|uniref:DUF2231 domain-containing protein n=1 Tax=Halomonas sp. HNIBRBA4712 TaxID=3373087 RepID=UPI003747707B